MKYLEQFVDKAKEFIKTRGLGFYFLVGAVILSLIQIIIYEVAFSHSDFLRYKHFSVTLLAVLAIIVSLGMTLTKRTKQLAPITMFFMELFSFMMLMKYGYMYFSELFFGGISLEVIGQMYYGYMGSIVLYVLIFIITIAAFFMKQSKNIEREEVSNEN